MQDTKIKEAVEMAAKKKVEIITDYKKDAKSIKGEFVDFLCGDLPKKEAKEIKREAKAAYSKLIKFSGEDGKEKLQKMVDTFVTVAKYYHYMKNDDLSEILANQGLTLNFNRSLMDDNPQIGNSVPENLVDILNDGAKNFVSVKAANDEINSSCPEEFSYSSENPTGMKKADFAKLVTAKAMESIKDEQEYSEYLTKISEDSVFNIEREKNLQDAIGDMMNH